MDMTDTPDIYRLRLYFSHRPQKYTIAVELLAKHIKSETTGKILGYIYLVKTDPPVWKKSICNELGRLYQGWKEHAGTDTIELILHKE